MRLSEKTPVMAVVFLVLAVAVGLGLWYMDVRQQAQTQHALEQTRDAFERFERERKVPNDGAGVSQGVTPPQATAPTTSASTSTPAESAPPARAGSKAADDASRSSNSREMYYLLVALLLTAVVALALAGSSYRLVQRERRARMEERHIMRETVVERSPVFRAGEGTIIDAEPVETVADGTPVYSPDPPPPSEAPRTAEMLRNWVEQSPLAVMLMQPSGEIEALNPVFTRLTGYTTKDIPNVQAWLARGQRVAADRQAAARDALRDRFTRGNDAPLEITVWTRGGEPLHWLLHTAVYRIGDDASAWLMLATDITERKQAENAAIERVEQARHESEELATLYQAAPVGLALLDTQLRFLRVNERLGEMSGLRPADHLGKPLRKVLPNVASAAEPLLERVIQSGASSINTWIAVRTPASPKRDLHWAVSCSPLKDASGRVMRIAFAAEDVTDRYQAETYTRENESALRAMFDHLPAPVCVKDTQGRYLYTNPAYEAFVHTAPGSLKGKMDHEVLPWEAADRLHENDDEALSSAGSVQSQGTVQLRDASIDYAASKIALRDQAGKPYAVCAIYTDWTAQQRTERDLKAAEARYRAIFESSPQPMFIDRDNKLVHVNAACIRLLAARDEQQLLGKSILDFIQQPGHKPFQERIQRVLRRKPSEAPLEVKVVRLDGNVIDAEIETALYEASGERAVQIVVRDITERKRADTALRDSEARLRRAIEDTPALIRIADGGGEATYWNAQWQRYTGLPADHGLGQRWTQLIHPDDREQITRALHEIRTQRSPTYLEYRLRDRSGTHRWVLDVVTPRFDDAGTFLGYIASASDIHYRKNLEDALKRDAGRLRAVAEHAPAMLWTESGDEVDLVNTAMMDELGLAGDAAAKWRERIHPDDRHEITERRQEAVRESRTSHASVRVQRADGEYRWMVATLVPHAASAGIVGSLTDVTDLRHAQLAARDADQRRNAFLAALAAEIRTPLEPLRHAAEVLRLTSRGDTQAQAASDIVVRHAQYLARLLNDAADASQMLAHPLPYQPSVNDVGDLVHRAIAQARPLIEARGLPLSLRMAGGRAQVHADADRMTQALARLLDYCASKANGLTVAAEEADGAAAIRIEASGLGLAESDTAAVFEFFPEQAGERREAGSLTLPFVRGLVETQGGKVNAEATSEGTRFTIRLPLHEAQPAVQKAVNGHRRVLVVDRDPDTAASLRMLLQLQGHDVRIASDRATAVPAAQEFHPDTVVIDSTAATGAPGELVRALRLLPETAHASLLCVSSEAAPDDPGQEGLFDHYLMKPVEPHVLQQVLERTSPTLH
ncbi:MAG: PAS domain S-box protein [Rhodospirillaceae bacterium]